MCGPGGGIGVFPYDMKALLLDVSYEPLDRAAPAAGQLEIRVAVTGLNFRDVMNAMGMYPDAERLNMPFGGECAARTYNRAGMRLLKPPRAENRGLGNTSGQGTASAAGAGGSSVACRGTLPLRAPVH